jgi:hydroxyacylglutathione hydrolase
MKSAKVLLLVFVTLLLIVLVYSVTHRRMLSLKLFALELGEVTLSEKYQEKEGVRWFDDYFTIESIDQKTFAIGEPRYWQANYNYLILGEQRAILFDSGPGVRDISPLIKSLTDLPVTVISSHLHFDHVGNHDKFKSVAMIDLPHLRALEKENRLQLSDEQHLGFLDNTQNPPLNISEWWQAEEFIDLGSRSLKVISAPGHTPDSIVLYDAERQQLFAGDYIYPGLLFASLPNSSLKEYLATTSKLLDIVSPKSILLTAHRTDPPGAPILKVSDLEDLSHTLNAILNGTIEGEGVFPRTYTVNNNIQLLTDISW